MDTISHYNLNINSYIFLNFHFIKILLFFRYTHVTIYIIFILFFGPKCLSNFGNNQKRKFKITRPVNLIFLT